MKQKKKTETEKKVLRLKIKKDPKIKADEEAKKKEEERKRKEEKDRTFYEAKKIKMPQCINTLNEINGINNTLIFPKNDTKIIRI